MIQHNVNGLLFKNGDAESLKQQLERIIHEPDLVQNLSKNIQPVRTFKDVANEHHQVYLNLMKCDFRSGDFDFAQSPGHGD